MKKRKKSNLIIYILIIIGGMVMLYPLVWLVFATLKPSYEVLNSAKILPSRYVFSNYSDGWSMIRPHKFTRFFFNTFVLVFGCVFGSVVISLFTGYGFARFRFRFRNFWLSILFITVMLPSTVTLISRYIIFTELKWINTYLPFIVPSWLGVGHGGGFFIYLMHQYIRGIPSELDEAAIIDGCNTFSIITKIIAPLSKAALFSVAIFAFIWNWDDFQNQLIYLSDVKIYTVSLALRTTIDVSGADNWGAVLAMALCSVIPAIILFFSAQKYFIEGIAATGIKG